MYIYIYIHTSDTPGTDLCSLRMYRTEIGGQRTPVSFCAAAAVR